MASAPGIPPLVVDPQLARALLDPMGSFADSTQLASPVADAWLDQDTDASPIEPKSAARSRRKASGGEHVKHRRTRSGCYTCRSRRVKCDEKRPICERCRKGSRDCVYPEANTQSKTSPKSSSQRHPSMDSVSEEDEEKGHGPSQPTEAEDPSAAQSRDTEPEDAAAKPRPGRRRPTRVGLEKMRSNSSTDSASLATLPASIDAHPWAELPRDQRFYLDYHASQLTCYHYLFKSDFDNFVHGDLLRYAREYDPLRYAVVGFAAFHYTVNAPDGKLTDFLTYYNQSVSLFRKSLQVERNHTEAMLITTLQLATFEEYLGDWANLLGHQRAANEILFKLFTPESLAATSTGRTIFTWCARFDIFAGLLAGNKTTLDIEWYRANERWYGPAIAADPSNMSLRIEGMNASHRLLGVELALLSAKLPKGEISFDEYLHAQEVLQARIQNSQNEMRQVLQVEEHQVQALGGPPDPLADEIIGPFVPGQFMKGPLFAANYLLLDWPALSLMAKYQVSMVLQQTAPPAELFELALQQVRVASHIDRYAASPRAALIPVQASLGLLCLFMPPDDRYRMWCRRMLAKIECLGYIYPPTYRTKIAESWQVPSMRHWWLPDEATFPPIVRALRSFIDERTIKPRSQVGEDLRAMKAMFQQATLDDGSNSPESIANTTASGTSSASGFVKVGSPNSDSVQSVRL